MPRLSPNDAWELEQRDPLSCAEIFARLYRGELSPSQLARRSDTEPWRPLAQSFTLKGPYGLLYSLGAGSFGTVACAFHVERWHNPEQRREVALKYPNDRFINDVTEASLANPPERHGDASAHLQPTDLLPDDVHTRVRRAIGDSFAREALLTARLAMCAEVVSVLDCDVKAPYLVLELCDGGSLAERCAQPYELVDVLRWGRQIARALEAAQDLQPDQLIHRDLKPTNVLLHEGKIKVSDFGAARMLDGPLGRNTRTSTFTPAYAAPESFDNKLVPGTDVWSLGVLLYELIAGRLPFPADRGIMALTRAILQDPPAPLSSRAGIQLPSALTQLVLSCLAKDPAARPRARDVRSILERLSGPAGAAGDRAPLAARARPPAASGAAASGAPASRAPLPAAPRPPRSRTLRLSKRAAGAVGAALLAALTIWTLLPPQEPAPLEGAERRARSRDPRLSIHDFKERVARELGVKSTAFMLHIPERFSDLGPGDVFVQRGLDEPVIATRNDPGGVGYVARGPETSPRGTNLEETFETERYSYTLSISKLTTQRIADAGVPALIQLARERAGAGSDDQLSAVTQVWRAALTLTLKPRGAASGDPGPTLQTIGSKEPFVIAYQLSHPEAVLLEEGSPPTLNTALRRMVDQLLEDRRDQHDDPELPRSTRPTRRPRVAPPAKPKPPPEGKRGIAAWRMKPLHAPPATPVDSAGRAQPPGFDTPLDGIYSDIRGLTVLTGGGGGGVSYKQGNDRYKRFGSSTCGGGSCHAASKPGDDRPANEYTTWQDEDRHSKAFATLYEEESADMAEELEIEDASTSPRCTSCHSTDVPKKLQGKKYNVEDGVSCDGCHGPAEGWFEPHTKPHKYEDMLKLGMWDTRDLWARADVCVLCHLQIEPELVDAGHPDLSFELVNHSRRQPPHWFERQTWDGLRSWSVGQAVSLRESFVKIEKRLKAEEPDEDAVSIAVAQATSYLNVFRHAIELFGDSPVKALVRELDVLLNAEELDNGVIKEKCGPAAKTMDALARGLAATGGFTKEQCRHLWAKITTDDEVLSSLDEYGAEQIAGALVGLYSSITVGPGPRGKPPMKVPEELEALSVRPTVYEPEDLFDAGEEEDQFNLAKWLERLKAAKSLLK